MVMRLIKDGGLDINSQKCFGFTLKLKYIIKTGVASWEIYVLQNLNEFIKSFFTCCHDFISKCQNQYRA